METKSLTSKSTGSLWLIENYETNFRSRLRYENRTTALRNKSKFPAEESTIKVRIRSVYQLVSERRIYFLSHSVLVNFKRTLLYAILHCSILPLIEYININDSVIPCCRALFIVEKIYDCIFYAAVCLGGNVNCMFPGQSHIKCIVQYDLIGCLRQ